MQLPALAEVRSFKVKKNYDFYGLSLVAQKFYFKMQWLYSHLLFFIVLSKKLLAQGSHVLLLNNLFKISGSPDCYTSTPQHGSGLDKVPSLLRRESQQDFPPKMIPWLLGTTYTFRLREGGRSLSV